jgi:hypothetical protein
MKAFYASSAESEEAATDTIALVLLRVATDAGAVVADEKPFGVRKLERRVR